MESQKALKEILIDCLKAPQLNIISISIQSGKKIISLDLENLTYAPHLEGAIIEDIPIYEGGAGLKNLLQSMVAGSDSNTQNESGTE